MGADMGGRPNQRRRTRKDLLRAAARLMRQGRRPSLEEIAEEALVSRATAYRYFPNAEALLVEAPLDLAIPDADELFAADPADDPVGRVLRVDEALHDMSLANEAALRMMLAFSLQRSLSPDSAGDAPARQNRRSPLIDAALEPFRAEFEADTLDRLGKALALIVGTEAMIVIKDVLQIDEQEGRDIKRWAIRTLVEAARRSASPD